MFDEIVSDHHLRKPAAGVNQPYVCKRESSGGGGGKECESDVKGRGGEDDTRRSVGQQDEMVERHRDLEREDDRRRCGQNQKKAEPFDRNGNEVDEIVEAVRMVLAEEDPLAFICSVHLLLLIDCRMNTKHDCC